MSFIYTVNKANLQPIEYEGLRRIGNPHDGGYVVPLEAVQRSRLLLSFGLSTDWTFERGVRALNPAIAVHVYDHTVGPKTFGRAARKALLELPLSWLSFHPRRAKRLYRNLQTSRDYFRFFQGDVRHFRQRVWYNEDRHSVPIAPLIQQADPGGRCSLFGKIDIEGSEYRILPDVIDQADRFSALAIEFHDVDICAGLFNQQVSQLLNSFHIVHVHGNNYRDLCVDHSLPNTLEITFIHKELVPGTPAKFRGKLPREALDSPNNPEREDYAIRF